MANSSLTASHISSNTARRRSPRSSTWLGRRPARPILVSEDGIEHVDPDELIDIAPGDQFRTKKRDDSQKPVEKPIRYTVNGEENATIELMTVPVR